MEIAKTQSYNLPGFGNMRICLYPHPLQVFQFLENYGQVSRLKQIDQLGPIREVFPGAHHTRYEYLMAQLSLITEICNLSGTLPTGITLSSNRDTFGQLPGRTKDPSNGEILMVLALLVNIGHLPSTFSGERAYLKFLRDNPKARSAFRCGLPTLDRKYFDKVVDSFETYHINYCMTAFLLNRYQRGTNGTEIVTFCHAILRSFVGITHNENEGLIMLWRLYKSIRRLTYIALDSHYAPVPFSLDLSSIFFNLREYLGDIFIEGTVFQDALIRLEGVMRDTVYLAPSTLINHAYVSEQAHTWLSKLDPPVNSITAHKELLRPGSDDKSLFALNGEWGTVKAEGPIVRMHYHLNPSATASLLPDPLQWEKDSRSIVGLRSCRIGAEFDPTKNHLFIAATLTSGLNPKQAWKASLKLCKRLVEFNLRAKAIVNWTPQLDLNNAVSVLRFLLSWAMGHDKEYRLTATPIAGHSPAIWCKGTKKAATKIGDLLTKIDATGQFNSDQKNEVRMLIAALNQIECRGSVIAFAGSTEVLNGGTPVAEFDGLVFLLSRETSEVTMVVVEAKNFSNGHTQAENQLKLRLKDLGLPSSSYKIEHLGRKGAFARVSLPIT